MRILVTNDDGFDAPGLIAVAGALFDAGHEVTVCAPLTERSGSGSSLGTIEDGSRIPLVEKRIDALGDTPVYAVDCPPALAVVAGCAGTFGRPPELVVSGINPGFNTGRSILFSSTVGAVLAAQVAGVNGVAVSTGFAPGHRFDTAAAVTCDLVQWVAERDAELPSVTLNVNVPDLDYGQLQGIRSTTLAAKSLFTLRLERTGDELLLRRLEKPDMSFPEGTDGAAVTAGAVSVTPLTPVGVDVSFLGHGQIPDVRAHSAR